jgi:hypothetical protein
MNCSAKKPFRPYYTLLIGTLSLMMPVGVKANPTNPLFPHETISAGKKKPTLIPIRFKLKQAGFVTLVIENNAGIRVRNLIADTWFAAGDNITWWDGLNDIGRDPDAAHHGVYTIPQHFVDPGNTMRADLFIRPLSHTMSLLFTIPATRHGICPTIPGPG